MRGSKILITGPSGQVAAPIAKALATDNEVWGIARFTDPAARESLEKAGVRCETVNLASGDFSGLPSDFDYVLNLAVAKSGQVGQGPRCQRRVGRPADGALPHREGVSALLVGCRLRPAGRRAPNRTRRPRRQPQAFVSNVFHLQDRRRGRRPDDVACARRARHHRAPQRALRRQRGMAVLPHGDDAGRHPDPGPARAAPPSTTRSTRTTSSR